MAADVVVGSHSGAPSDEEQEEGPGDAATAAVTATSSSTSSSRPGCPDMSINSSSSGSSSSSSRPGSPQREGRRGEDGGLLTSQQTTDLEVVCSSPCSSKQGAEVTSVTSSSHCSDTGDAADGCPARYSSGGCELEPATPVSDVTGCGPHTSMSDSRCLSDEDLDVCGVCLDAPVNIQLQSCQHPLCAGCAERVVSMQTTRPAACPFCRLHISGFQALQIHL